LGRSASARVAILAAIVLLLPQSPVYASHRALSEIRKEMSVTRTRIAALQNDDQQIVAILNQVGARLAEVQGELAAQRALLAKIDLKIRTEVRRLDALQTRINRRRAVIDARARSLYMSGDASTPEPTSVMESLTRAGMLEYVASFDKQVLEDIAELQDEAREARAALRAERAEQAGIEAGIADRAAAVAEIVATQQAAHNRLSSKIQAERNMLGALEREQTRIQNLIIDRSGGVNTGGSSRYGYAWPIRGPITSGYGPRWGGYHTGIDIDCETGNAIGASKAGRVIAAEWGGGYGNMVIIDHGGGYSTLYAHMSAFAVRRGSVVQQHQRVGSCGSTGNSTGDHLHFEVRVNGQHRNPMGYLP
jgi:murein DD-endopeptidase MepM/ murein hydrolase activator NlpD